MFQTEKIKIYVYLMIFSLIKIQLNLREVFMSLIIHINKLPLFTKPDLEINNLLVTKKIHTSHADINKYGILS